MSPSASTLRLWILGFISESFKPFEIGLRRRAILDQVIRRSRLSQEQITTDFKNAMDMRLLRVLKSLVQEELIKKVKKGHKQTFYLLGNGAYSEYLEYLEEYAGVEIFLDKREYDKIFRNKIISRSDYLKLPDYMDMIPITDMIHRDLTYDEFRSKIMTVASEVLEPQIKAQYELMKKDQAHPLRLSQISVPRKTSS